MYLVVDNLIENTHIENKTQTNSKEHNKVIDIKANKLPKNINK